MILSIQGKKMNFIRKNLSFVFSWHKLTNKDGKFDKDRGEIEASLQFYSKNNTTGSVLDLSTKKKHLSLTDVKQSLSKKRHKIKKNISLEFRREIKTRTKRSKKWW
jgi:hypothetical protein